jgi:hypothetical protein
VAHTGASAVLGHHDKESTMFDRTYWTDASATPVTAADRACAAAAAADAAHEEARWVADHEAQWQADALEARWAAEHPIARP